VTLQLNGRFEANAINHDAKSIILVFKKDFILIKNFKKEKGKKSYYHAQICK